MIGEMSHYCEILEPTASVDAAGGPVESFAVADYRWGRLRGAFAGERVSSNQLVAKVDAVLTLWWDELAARITARWRIRIDEVTYNVLSATPHMDTPNRSVELRLERHIDE